MPEDILTALAAIVGDDNVLTDNQFQDRSEVWGTNQPCLAKAVVCPATSEEVSQILAACHEAGQPVVPFGGLTNLVQGATTGPDDIALSLERMDRIETVDATNVDTSFVGHSYYGENRSVMSDLFNLLRERKSANTRFGLAPVETARGTYWRFQR